MSQTAVAEPKTRCCDHDRVSQPIEHVVADVDTAIALGSGSVPVLATPRLLAWLEEASCAAIDADVPGACSVGTRVTLEHLVASPVGAAVRCRATVVLRDGRLFRVSLEATDASGRLLATGELTRVVVDRDRFLDRSGGSG